MYTYLARFLIRSRNQSFVLLIAEIDGLRNRSKDCWTTDMLHYILNLALILVSKSSANKQNWSSFKKSNQVYWNLSPLDRWFWIFHHILPQKLKFVFSGLLVSNISLHKYCTPLQLELHNFTIQLEGNYLVQHWK